jgi:hypothetical protein
MSTKRRERDVDGSIRRANEDRRTPIEKDPIGLNRTLPMSRVAALATSLIL